MARVLVVDDEPETARMLSAALELFGHTPSMALSGQEALEIAEEDPPEAVLLDLMMPVMDGFEVTRRLRQLPGTAEAPIIVITASQDPQAERRAKANGANVFLRKPISIGQLADILNQQLKR
ncbi:MAG: response regulator [Chloroflexi bacterium]|nr:response regulator [Chloroflexota bacterium]